MTEVLNRKGKPFSWSFTSMNEFDKVCALKYARSRFFCDVPFASSETSIWGDRVHKAAETLLSFKYPADKEAALPVEPYVTKMIRSGLQAEAELEIALNRDLKRTSWFAKDCWFRIKLDVVLTNYARTKVKLFDWKGLALDTLIPTPNGWTTMEGVKEGDRIFGGDGRVCTVVGESPIFNRPCYELLFRDGAKVVCDDRQLWVTRVCGKGSNVDVISTDEIFSMTASGKNISIPLGKAAVYRKNSLRVHPYVLGCWLGDGSRSKGEITKGNSKIFTKMADLGYVLGPDISSGDRCEVHTVYGLMRDLRYLGLLQNKHIPAEYMQSSIGQRLDLLRGICDTDGRWNFTRKQVVVTTVDERFASQVSELLASLGQRPYCVALRKHGFGRTVTCYDIIFTPVGINPFAVHPKKEDVDNTVFQTQKNTRRYLKSIKRVLSVPTKCIAVNSPDNTYLVTNRYIVTHNTGKTIKDDDDQLRLGAAALSVVRPYIEEFTGKYIWTAHKQVTGMRPLKKEDIPAVWAEFLPRVKRMEDAWKTENFPARRSGLCGKYCEVFDCIHNGRRR